MKIEQKIIKLNFNLLKLIDSFLLDINIENL
jgi:hypothetical protein